MDTDQHPARSNGRGSIMYVARVVPGRLDNLLIVVPIFLELATALNNIARTIVNSVCLMASKL